MNTGNILHYLARSECTKTPKELMFLEWFSPEPPGHCYFFGDYCSKPCMYHNRSDVLTKSSICPASPGSHYLTRMCQAFRPSMTSAQSAVMVSANGASHRKALLQVESWVCLNFSPTQKLYLKGNIRWFLESSKEKKLWKQLILMY